MDKRDWKSDLTFLRKKTRKGVSSSGVKSNNASRPSNNVSENNNQGTSLDVRGSLSVNDDSLAIVDPTLSMYSDSTPKFKARRDFIASPTTYRGNNIQTSNNSRSSFNNCNLNKDLEQSSIENYDSSTYTQIHNFMGTSSISIDKNVDEDENQGKDDVIEKEIDISKTPTISLTFNSETKNKRSIDYKVENNIDINEANRENLPNSPSSKSLKGPQQQDHSPESVNNNSAKFKTPSRIPVLRSHVKVSPTTPKEESNFAKQLQTSTSNFNLPMSTGRLRANPNRTSREIEANTTNPVHNDSFENSMERMRRSQSVPSMKTRHTSANDNNENNNKNQFKAADSDNIINSLQKVTLDDTDISRQDEWKEAQTPGGRRYYYNRRTRRSSWKLPTSAMQVNIEGNWKIYAPKTNERTPQRTPQNTSRSTQLSSNNTTPHRDSVNIDRYMSMNIRSEERIRKMYTPPSVDPQSRQRDLKEKDRGDNVVNESPLSNAITMGERPRPLVEIQEISDSKGQEPNANVENNQNGSMSIINGIRSLSMQNSQYTSSSVLNPDDELQYSNHNINNDRSLNEHNLIYDVFCPFCAAPTVVKADRRDNNNLSVNSGDQASYSLSKHLSTCKQVPSKLAGNALECIFSHAINACLDSNSNVTVTMNTSNSRDKSNIISESLFEETEVSVLASTIDNNNRQNISNNIIDHNNSIVNYNNNSNTSVVSGDNTINIESLPSNQDAIEVCEECGRKFSFGRLASHAKVCRRVFKEKRTPFDGRRMRMLGTPFEFNANRTPEHNKSTHNINSHSSSTKKSRRQASTPSSSSPATITTVPGSGMKNYGITSTKKTALHESNIIVNNSAHANGNVDVCMNNSNAFACPYCADCQSTTRDELFQHLRKCVEEFVPESLTSHFNINNTNDQIPGSGEYFKGNNQGRNACPFCAVPTNNLSSHLLQCNRKKEAHSKRYEAGVPGLYTNQRKELAKASVKNGKENLLLATPNRIGL